MVYVTRYSKSINRNVRYVKKRIFKNFSKEEFMADIKRIKWWPGVYSCANASVAADNLNQELSKVLDKWAPIRKVQIRQNYRPWISKETKDLINQRNLAQELASRSNKAEDWQKFKDLRNKVVTRT